MPDLTAWRPQRKWRRSGPQSVGSSPTVCSRPWRRCAQSRLVQALDEQRRRSWSSPKGCRLTPCYAFKHALVQDAAYSTLLKSRRRQLHARIATVLEEQFPEQAETQPDLVAHHAAEAGLNEKAIDYWQRAGERGVARAAMKEAAAVLGKALALLESSPPGPRASSEGTRFATRPRHHAASTQGLSVGPRRWNVHPGASPGRGSRSRNAADPGASRASSISITGGPSWIEPASSAAELLRATRQYGQLTDIITAYDLVAGVAFSAGDFEKSEAPVQRGSGNRGGDLATASCRPRGRGGQASYSPTLRRWRCLAIRTRQPLAATRRSKRFGRFGTTTAWSSHWATRAVST